MENKLIFDITTNTLRQMPQDYVIAQRKGELWTCDSPPKEADPLLVGKVVLTLQDYFNRQKTGFNLIKEINDKPLETPKEDIIKILSISKDKYPEIHKWAKENLVNRYLDNFLTGENIYGCYMQMIYEDVKLPEFMKDFQTLLLKNDCSYFRLEI